MQKCLCFKCTIQKHSCIKWGKYEFSVRFRQTLSHKLYLESIATWGSKTGKMYQLARTYMDENEHERLSKVTLRHKLPVNEVIKQLFYCCSTCQSHSKIFNKEPNLYPKMRVKDTLACCWAANSLYKENFI